VRWEHALSMRSRAMLLGLPLGSYAAGLLGLLV
jgi:hypothetical protein